MHCYINDVGILMVGHEGMVSSLSPISLLIGLPTLYPLSPSSDHALRPNFGIMSPTTDSDNYRQGYSSYTTATHERRTVESSAAFLIPYIKKTDHILDIGCGPGTITTGFAKYAPEGIIVGLDMSVDVLERARKLATEASVPTDGPGGVRFEQGNVLETLPYSDDTFDIVYCSQVLGHMPPPDLPRRALTEMRRVLKPGGILASRDAVSSMFHPRSIGLDRLWSGNLNRVLRQGAPADVEDTGVSLPAFYRSVGFDADRGKIRIGAGSMVVSDPETRKWFAWRTAGQLKPEDSFYQSWLSAGIFEEEIQETVRAVNKWAETEDAWFAALQCEMLAWK
ncbi:S-adenosyl-L-methionine-dependent methyltransferase [Nemania sp. FL0916]|nr:S-adenosyl-L-methionine-dependent methyltransferase [Nemania sp. FL0916]